MEKMNSFFGMSPENLGCQVSKKEIQNQLEFLEKKNNTIGEMAFCFQNCSALMWEKNCSSDWEKHLKFEGKVKNWSYQKMNMLIFGKKSTNFVSLSLKLDNPNWHSLHPSIWRLILCKT